MWEAIKQMFDQYFELASGYQGTPNWGRHDMEQKRYCILGKRGAGMCAILTTRV